MQAADGAKKQNVEFAICSMTVVTYSLFGIQAETAEALGAYILFRGTVVQALHLGLSHHNKVRVHRAASAGAILY